MDGATLSIHDITRQLNQWLGNSLVAVLSSAKDVREPSEWENSDGAEPPSDVQERLRSAHSVWGRMVHKTSDDEARLWFTGSNKLLSTAPVVALRDGRVKDFEEAADAFLGGAWSL
ncbi:hypothetical protein [Streptomyces sp. NRRL S-87]|uniref:hypothetical protein n=1 Tax=Streptomyces sp. NRRL S-87 TaxID=1463920 RepID=UPI00131DCA53|nr:hypothetical protein [Streptomyces sp. NRRL S-87]